MKFGEQKEDSMKFPQKIFSRKNFDVTVSEIVEKQRTVTDFRTETRVSRSKF